MSGGTAGRKRRGSSDAEPQLAKLLREAGPSPGSFWLGLVLGVLLVAAAALLIVQNGQSTSVTWLTLHFNAPLWLLLLASMVAGTLIGLLAVLLWRLHRTRTARRRSARARLDQLSRGEASSPRGTDGPSPATQD